MDALSRVELYMARFSCSAGVPVKLASSSFATCGASSRERKPDSLPPSPVSAASSRSNSTLSLSVDARDELWY